MDLRFLTPDLAVAPQIDPEDLPALAAQGFATVIDNRPDEEVTPDLGSAAMRAAAERAGLAFHVLPVHPGQMTEAMVLDFARLTEDAAPKVLAYCRSGTRSATLWAVAQAIAGREGRSAEDILGAAAKAGYDLSGMAPMIRRALQSRG